MSRSSLALCLRLRWGVRWCVHVRRVVVHEDCVDILPRRSHCSSNASLRIPMRAPSSSRWLGRSLTRSQSTPSAAHKCSSTALSTSALASFLLRHHSRGIALTLRVVSCRFAEATQRLLRRRWPSRVSSIGAAESSGAAPRETPRCCWWMCQAHANTMACRSPRGSAASVRNPRPAACMHGVG